MLLKTKDWKTRESGRKVYENRPPRLRTVGQQATHEKPNYIETLGNGGTGVVLKAEDAGPDLPLYRQAKTEYSKLN